MGVPGGEGRGMKENVTDDKGVIVMIRDLLLVEMVMMITMMMEMEFR